jgi:branched-chain amino acid transport system substrate-binding protein
LHAESFEREMRKPAHSFWRSLPRWAGLLAILGMAALARGQKKSSAGPYASIGSKGVSYQGPGRQKAFDLPGPTIRIGLLAPLRGPQQADGKAIVAAARMALHDATRRPLPGGLHLALAIGDESGPSWGHVAEVVIHLVFDEHAVGIVTSASGAVAHLSEQVGNRVGVPVLTLSTDPTTTEIDLPWIFRMGPSDAVQAQTFARSIYRECGFRRVLLISGTDHDGRVGHHAFLDAARRLGVSAPDSLLINPLDPDVHALLAAIQAKPPQAIVFWTLPENARQLLATIREHAIRASIYLSQEAAQEGSGMKFLPLEGVAANDPPGAGIYTVASERQEMALRKSFVRRYRLATGADPSPVAAEAYDAIRLIARAVRKAGPNRARVRDQISRDRNLSGVSGTIAFDDQGNNRAGVRLLRLR